MKCKKAFGILTIALILILSTTVFLLRDQISSVSNWGYLGVFLLCFLANSTIMLPSPSLMVAAVSALILNPVFVAILAALGSATGELMGYILGNAANDLSPRLHSIVSRLQARISSPAALVFIMAALPLPLFDIAGIYSGSLKMNPVRFYLLCFLGKLLKMSVYIYLCSLLRYYPDLKEVLLP